MSSVKPLSHLHFDGDPGFAAGGAGNGKRGLGLWHRLVPPTCCQLVQFGRLTLFVPAAGTQSALSTSTVINCPAVETPFNWNLSADVVCPQLSGAGTTSRLCAF